MVELLDAAIRTRLFASVGPKLRAVTSHRPDTRSYRTRGENVGWEFRIVLKNTSVSALSAPSAAPVALSKVRSRPFTPTRNWDGPTAPEVSGGNVFASARLAPRKLTPSVWGA